MALLQLQTYSHALAQNTSINIILPLPGPEVATRTQGTEKGNRKQYKTLYLLHGTFGDHSDWCRYTCIERYAAEMGVAIVMPACQNSYYQNMRSGGAFLDYVSEELPQLTSSILPLSSIRDDRFIAGLSMGGYGALHAAFARPKTFSAAISLSGGLSIASILNYRGPLGTAPWPVDAIFGPDQQRSVMRSDANLKVQVRSLKRTNTAIPRIFLSVGKSDFTLKANRDFRRFLAQESVSAHYEEHEGGHDWYYWDTHIKTAMEWMLSSEDTRL